MKKREKEYSVSLIASLLFLLFIIFIMVAAPLIARHDPTEVNLAQKFASASWEYPFGADDFGRCIFCRCIYATRTSVCLSFTIEFASVIIGMFIGMTSAYVGGALDQAVSIVCEALLSFPSIILVMLIVAFLGADTKNIIIAMLLVNWIWFARITRGLTFSLKERGYVQAARLAGASPAVIILRHICPNVLSQMVVQFTLSLGSVVLSLAGLSFLGIGIQRPTPELGLMISDGCKLIRTNFSLLFWPSLFLFLIVLDFNVLGEQISARLRRKA